MSDDEEIFAMPMIFVTGASRSGTTMLSRMLGQHSRIADLKELHCFGDLVDPDRLQAHIGREEAIRLSTRLIARNKRDVWGSVLDQDRTEAEQLWQGIADNSLPTSQVISLTLEHLAARQGKTIACEQTPRNIFYAGPLLNNYPDLRIVHIVRDPRDVLASQKNRWKRKRLGGDNIPYSEIVRVWFNYHPYTIGKLWAKATSLALQHQEHTRFFLLRFEDIIASPESELRKLCSFLDIPFEDAMLNIPQVGSSHRSNTDQQTGVAQSSLNQWVENLTSGEVFICERITKPLMQALDYSPSAGASAISPSVIAQALKYPLHVAGVLVANPRRAWIQLQAVLGKSR
jgi:omega-hydroxy-beta-dihydromenaquinone-9 sulfotransferase